MKITIFNSSPRLEKGNTHIICKAFADGARSAGADVEEIFLARKKIHHCIGCFDCWEKTPGICTIKDDMSELLKTYSESDLVVCATPLYVDNVSGIMKNFMDRLVPVADGHFGKDAGGECRHEQRGRGPAAIGVISNCGFPEQSHFQVLKLLFKRMARNMSSKVAFEIYRGMGELLSADSLFLKPIVWNYLRHVKHAGSEVVKTGGISEATMQKLEEPLIPEEKYIAEANKYFDKMDPR